jgi:rsbT co-antagonist protein RsbR
VQGARRRDAEKMDGPAWQSVRELLDEVSRARALTGAYQTGAFVLSLKKPLFQLLRGAVDHDFDRLGDTLWTATQLLDNLALYTGEQFQKSREEVITRQKDELLELSTPVLRLWDRIVALPLIGTLDSARTQVMMETLLENVVAAGAEIAIIDITGVPTVDTLVAQHLIKTVSEARAVAIAKRRLVRQLLPRGAVALREAADGNEGSPWRAWSGPMSSFSTSPCPKWTGLRSSTNCVAAARSAPCPWSS